MFKFDQLNVSSNESLWKNVFLRKMRFSEEEKDFGFYENCLSNFPTFFLKKTIQKKSTFQTNRNWWTLRNVTFQDQKIKFRKISQKKWKERIAATSTQNAVGCTFNLANFFVFEKEQKWFFLNYNKNPFFKWIKKLTETNKANSKGEDKIQI